MAAYRVLGNGSGKGWGLMNMKPHKEQVEIIQAFVNGASVRKVVRVFGCAKGTALRYRQIAEARYGFLPACGCGRPSEHKGWCAGRVKESVARQELLTRWGRWQLRPVHRVVEDEPAKCVPRFVHGHAYGAS